MMVIGFQLSMVAAKAGSFFSRLCRLLSGFQRWTLGVGCSMLDVQIFTYDSLGQPLLTCQDLNLDGEIDLAGPDRVSGQTSRTIQLSGDWWRESASWTYPATGSSVPLTNAISRTRLTGLGIPYSANGASGILSAESVSIDARGNQTTSRTVFDRDSKTVYRLTDTPHSTIAALSTTVNGLLLSSRSTSGLVTSYTYDALGRQIATQDARGSVHARGYDALGRVAWETDPATNGTWSAYDSLGRRIAVTNALGQVTHTEYDAEGRIIKTYGATYPVAYDYDAFGRMVSMKTFRDEQGAGDETRWFYEEATGLLTNKVYADGKGTAYSYTADGKLASRAWARGVGTAYVYDNTGSLTNIVYSDDTPAVSFAYDRLGRMTSAIATGVSTNLFTYDGLDLVSETQNGMEITRTTDALGRDTGFSLGSDYSVQYGFDAYGRFHSISSSVQSVSSVVQYSRLADSDLLSGRSLEIGNSLLAVGYSYEAARSLITSVENTFDETVISQYDYTNDELGRRTHIARSGLAFGNLPVRDAYGYNARSEVTSARRALADNPNQNVRGFSYDYEYDPIGNRTSSTEYDHEDSALVSAYTANELNQYGQRTVPGYAGVRGEADTNAVVTVNGNPTWRLDEYFYGGDDADNSLDAVMKQLEIIAVQSNLYSAVTGRVFVAETPEAFTYDDDGNLTQDGRFDYAWNGENRLIKAETRDDLPASVPHVKVEYAYDHQGRRVAAATSAWTNDAWQAVESRAFLYDGWNVITETIQDLQSTITNAYVWGLDLSGSLQGAGGISGLLAATLGGTTALYCYDANGNVGQLVAPDGELLAHYEYSPFGETVVSTGPLAETNPFRFSTKWFDNATALGDWGYRWYSPEQGRWAGRDPLQEQGGLNLYAFVNNSPILYYDPLGESVVGDIWELLKKYTNPQAIYQQLKNLYGKFKSTACPKIKAAQNNDIINCGCGVIGVADVASSAPWIEGLDCACNALSSLGQMCDTGISSWQLWAYSSLTAIDCASAPVAIVLGGLIGEAVDPAGGGIIGAIIGATPAGDAAIDVAAMAFQNVISQGTPLPLSQGKSCCNLIEKAASKLGGMTAKAECACKKYLNP